MAATKAAVVAEPAWAKVNLALHVTGRRADGYHLLDSLVVFADVADRVTVARAGAMALTVVGPRAAGVPDDARNLVWRAAEAMAAGPVAITLEKHLPAAAGIGGGSADAAATLRAVARLTGAALPDAAAVLALGADVPVCLHAPRPTRMRGVGERLDPVPALPPLWLVLVNPGVEVPTGAVFRALASADQPPLTALPPQFADAAAVCDWLAAQRNDLEAPAMALAPAIAATLGALRAQPGCRLARMSGSGATCFGLFPAEAAAKAAAAALLRPGWWVAAAPILG